MTLMELKLMGDNFNPRGLSPKQVSSINKLLEGSEPQFRDLAAWVVLDHSDQI